MKTKRLLCIAVCLLVTCSVWANGELSIYDILQIAETLEVGEFTAIFKMSDQWVVKGTNMSNEEEAELHIDALTGLVQYSMNVTPKDLVIGENTYGFSGVIQPYSDKFYHSGIVVNGLKIYQIDSTFYRLKNAIFIQNMEGFVTYYMYKGPGVKK